MHHKIESLWRIGYTLTISDNSILLYSIGRTEEARDIWARAGLREAVARRVEELPVVFGETLEGKPVISGNEVKGIFRHFIAASLTSKGHKVCVPSTKRHMVKRREGKREVREYYIPEERLSECRPEEMCFLCRWFGTASYESPLYFSFLVCDQSFKEAMSTVVPMIAFDEEFGGTAGEALAGFIGVKGGTQFKGDVTGINLNEVVIGALYDVVKASEKGFIKFGRLRTRGFGRTLLQFTEVEKYSTAPFKLEFRLEGEDATKFLEECLKKYSEFAKKPSEPEEVSMKCVEIKGA